MRTALEEQLAALPGGAPTLPDIELREGDFLREDWSDGDFVLVNSTCFSEGLMRRLAAEAARQLHEGAVFVTLSHELDQAGGAWEHLENFERRMSWGPAMVHIWRRTAVPAPEPGADATEGPVLLQEAGTGTEAPGQAPAAAAA